MTGPGPVQGPAQDPIHGPREPGPGPKGRGLGPKAQGPGQDTGPGPRARGTGARGPRPGPEVRGPGPRPRGPGPKWPQSPPEGRGGWGRKTGEHGGTRGRTGSRTPPHIPVFPLPSPSLPPSQPETKLFGRRLSNEIWSSAYGRPATEVNAQRRSYGRRRSNVLLVIRGFELVELVSGPLGP